MTGETISEGSQQALAVSVTRASELFGVTEKTVRSWIRSGLKTMKSGGKGAGNGALIDLAVLIPWYLEDNALEVAKTRLAIAQSDKYEMENSERRGELLDANVVTATVSDHIAAARAKLLAMPTKLGPQLVNVPDANTVNATIKQEIYAALTELASWRPAQLGEEVSRRLGAAARTDSESVGGPKPKAKQRKQRRAGTMAN